MSYGLTANDWMDAAADPAPPPTAGGISPAGLTVLPADAPAQVRRSPVIPVVFVLPLLVSALSYVGGGVPLLSDCAFLILTVTCLVLVTIELLAFGRRQGIGAILIYGGVLIWFCHDYASTWFLHDFARFDPFFPAVTPETVARALFYHCLFIEIMVVAFRFPVLRFADRLIVAVPEPADSRFYVGLVAALLLLGWSAFLFTADVLPVSLLKGCLWFLPSLGPPTFVVGRTGNLNYNLGGYVTQLIQMGQIGGILGVFYALLVARNLPGRLFGWFCWLYWASFSFTTYRRGDIAFMALPVLGIMFLKYHAQRDPERRSRNFARLLLTGIVLALIWVAVADQSAERNNESSISLFKAVGNTMFSEGLNSWVVIPSTHGYPYNTWFGEGILRPLPDTLWWFAIGPIPRYLWTTKPVEQFALWYSSFISHDYRGVETGGLIGTTISGGAVGAWYFRYGPAGVIEGALIYGWLMGVAERALRRTQGRPLKAMFALLFATFMFRCYRDLWWQNLYPLLIGEVVLWVIIRALFNGGGGHPTHELPAA